MRKFIAALFYCFCFSISNAQYVAIADTNFGMWLNSQGYAQCMIGNNANGWQMDTTCSQVVNQTHLDCSNYGIQNLSGISYFDNLKSLTCAGLHSLSILPALPPHLTSLICAIGQLVTLPPLPAGLLVLDCSRNQLISLPIIPNSVTHLLCDNNQLASAPDLPDSLTYCSFSSNPDLKCLPRLTTIVNLYYNNTSISCIPNLGNVTNSSPALNSMPFCDIGNSNGCEVISSVLQFNHECCPFSVFPNPASNSIFVSMDVNNAASTLTITDITGRRIAETILTTGNTQLSTEALPDGLYFVAVYKDGIVSTQKLLISR
ncbi:MAG TPA: T9SS type A sorting domain-containing protein [Chitinophagales bacterium]|nr:T9SS type A sorting domain-containing protein [Chitinophagales bacterium]